VPPQPPADDATTTMPTVQAAMRNSRARIMSYLHEQDPYA
jgi:hypothetical protein